MRDSSVVSASPLIPFGESISDPAHGNLCLEDQNSNSAMEMPLKESKAVVPLNTWVLISNLKVAYNLTRRPDGTFNRYLAEYLDRKVEASITPRNGVASVDLNIDKTTGVWARIFIPSAAYEVPIKVPLIIYFHGGSFAHSSANSALYDTVCRRIALSCTAVIIAVNYRRAPEFKCPAPYEDGFVTLKWLQAQAEQGVSSTWLPQGADLKRVFLMGDSSGGNIAHHVGMRAAVSDLGPVVVAGNILMMPMFGGSERTGTELKLDGKYFVTMKDRDYYWKLFLPEGSDRDHPACNVLADGGIEILKQTPLPRSLVIIAGLDMLQDWQISYAQGLQSAGKDVQILILEEATVGFFIFPNTDYFTKFMDSVCKFVRNEES